MQLLTSPSEARAWSRERRRVGESVGFVPTMGALHEGHLALVEEARRRADCVVVSIFVNPLQFDRRDDFDLYPRPIDDDLEVCRQHGVDAVYAPTPAVMYPEGFDTHVEPGSLATRLEGERRPGHFRGVTTVVTKLLAAVEPDVAVFGEKDFQQLAVVRRMVADLDLGVEIVGSPTVREPDGVALSSRNRRLDEAARAAASRIPRALAAASAAYHAGVTSAAELEHLVAEHVGDVPLDYVAVVDPATLESVEHVEGHHRVLLAGWFGGVRLIDNCRIADGPGVEL